jgi:hypothetical protein
MPAEAVVAGLAEAVAVPGGRRKRRRIAVSRTVVLLGLVSLCTDLSARCTGGSP